VVTFSTIIVLTFSAITVLTFSAIEDTFLGLATKRRGTAQKAQGASLNAFQSLP